ncbi:TetR/AcrR family transcriptional regulator [Pseudonocardia sp. GCM10023141]|uniref:TetR/AcrR family transcriptional regulator n=1 Tax=Pseudonocardia sp. GCM10023141 TaxID=3252653 RepID=UPI003614C0A7
MARVSAEVRREELVEAAIRVMARDGVAAATTRAIVAEAGMQLGFFSYCFTSKHELFLQVIETINRRNLLAGLSVIEPGEDLRSTMRASVRAYFRAVEENPGEHQVTYELTQVALRTPELADLARRQYEHYLQACADYLTTAAAASGTQWSAPLPVLARALHSALDGATLAWIVDRDSAAALDVLALFADHLATSARPGPILGHPY